MKWQASRSAEPDTERDGERDSRSSDDRTAISQPGAGAWSRPVVTRFGLDRTLTSPISEQY
jgi:hypothetical protein